MNIKLKIFLILFLTISINCKEYDKLTEADKQKNAGEKINLVMIESGSYSGYNESGIVLKVIEDKNSFNELYRIIHSINLPQPQLPGIDFNTEILLAAFSGRKPTGGYSIDLVNAQLTGNSRLYVEVLTKEPQSGSILTQAVTSPYALASVKRGDFSEIVFLDRNRDILKKVKIE